MVVKIVRRIFSIVCIIEFNTVLEVEDMGFMVGKSSDEPSLNLHLLWLEMQPLYQDAKICDLRRISSPRMKLLAARCECLHLIKINSKAL